MMPLLLDVALSVGDLDPDGNITHCRVRFRDNDPDMQRILTTIDYGRMPGSNFIPATIQPTNLATVYEIVGQDYVDLVTTHTPNEGELTYEAAKRGLYEFLITNEVIPDGTIV